MYQLDIVCAQHETQLRPPDLGKDEGRKGQVVGVHVLFRLERAVGRLRVRALHEPDRRFEWQEPDDVCGCAMKVRLKTDACAGVIPAQPRVEVDRPIGVAATLHIDPQEALYARCGRRQPLKVRVGGPGVEVQPELRGLYRDLEVNAGRGRL